MIPKFFTTDKFVYIAISLVIFALYANSLGNDFVSDDRSGLLLNPYVNDWDYVFRGFIGWGTAVIRLVMWNIFGPQAWAHRLLNILLHIGYTCAAYYLFKHLYNKTLGLLVVFLFAVHPILVESITWISGTAYPASGLLFLVSFILFLESEDKYDWRYYLSLVLYLGSVLTSEKAVTLALIYPLYKYIYSQESKASFLKSASYLVISLFFGILLVLTLTKRTEILATEYNQEGGMINPLYQIPIAIGEYIKLFFWPQALTLYHSETVYNYFQYFIFLAVFLAIVIPIVIFLIKIRGGVGNLFKFWADSKHSEQNYSKILDYKFIVFWFSYFFVSLILTLTPFKVSWLVAERYVYIGALGFLAIIAFIIYKLLKFEQIKIAVIGIFVVVLIALGIRTAYRNLDWYNEDTLWFATVKYSPSSPNIYNNLGDVYSRRGDLDKAIENFRYATVVKPNYADAYHNLAYTYQLKATQTEDQQQRSENLDLAKENYLNAVKYNPYLWQSRQNLALVYFEEGDLENGYKEYATAIQINPSDVGLLVTYIQVNLQLKNYDEAEKTALYLLSLQPTNMEFQNIVTQVRAQRDSDKPSE